MLGFGRYQRRLAGASCRDGAGPGRDGTMTTRHGRRRGRAIAGALLATGICGAGRADAQVLGPDFSAAELKCQNGIAAAEGKLLDARTKCIAKCLKAARTGTVPVSDCQGPLFGGDTAICIRDASKGAEAKATAAIGKACAADCPDCYAGADCAARATQVVAQVPTAADTQLMPYVYCGSQPALSAGQAKCEDTAAKAVTKLAGALVKCATKCKSAESKGDVPVGACAPPADDVRAAECTAKAQGKAIATIEKACTVDPPTCYPPFASTLLPGLATSLIESRHTTTWCGS